MPKRTDIRSIAIIGAGPIVIGQACEFDYSGTQACQALRAEGYRIILINSNPATIMTDPQLADATYIEPITPATVAQILEIERPDALLPTMGGQTALNTALALAADGTLYRLGIELIGANREAIAKAEDRLLFKEAMAKIGLDTPKSSVVRNMAEAQEALKQVGLPAIIRPSFTLGGTGGGIAYNREQFEEITRGGIDASPVGEVLIEESVLGWKEFEMEVVRDKADNAIIVCSIENIDPMGVHTGDSITVAPALTLTDKEYQIMRNASLAVLREIGVETGGSNVQFAINPANGRMIVIEMNPRVSRSSALASKATGFPIAKIAAKLAVGYTLDELKNDLTGTPASFEPSIDYVVVKIPRFAFEKYKGADTTLTTAMKSVGEAMAMGRNFKESLQKALRSLERNLEGFTPFPIANRDALVAALSVPTAQRILAVGEAFRMGMSEAEVHQHTKIDPWFLTQIAEIIALEAEVAANGLPDTAQAFRQLKGEGFSDKRLGELVGRTEVEVCAAREALDVTPTYRRIDTCAAEFPTETAYMYSTYEVPFFASHTRTANPPLAGGSKSANADFGVGAITLRAATDNDQDFVDQLTRTVMLPYVQQTWKNQNAIEHYFKINAFDQSPNQIIEYDGLDVGRFSVVDKGDELYLDNLHISPEYQGKGIGRYVIENIFAKADVRGLPVTLLVLEVNPAKKLYERLGFEIYDSKDNRFCMRRIPHTPPQNAARFDPPARGGLAAGTCEARPSSRKKVAIIGGGPNRIGQGIEFDYCCVHAAYALRDADIETIMINCNPETVSTDYDTSDRLYFEPLTPEDVLAILRVEASAGELLGVICQFGGQTPLKLAPYIQAAGFKILGTPLSAIDMAEDRELFQKLLHDLGLKQPRNGLARSGAEAEIEAEKVGYPVVIRPSYVLGGQGMEIVGDVAGLRKYIASAVKISGDAPVLIDAFLQDAIEVDVDAICDGTDVFVAGVMEHIEEAGIHSGDSACALPPFSLSAELIAQIEVQTKQLALALGVIGLINIQFAIKDNDIYLLEVNPRASRTAPFVAKARGLPIVNWATQAMLGVPLSSFKISTQPTGYTAVKEAVFPFKRFPGVDVLLSPEMKSTGEVMGIDRDFPRAFIKAQRGAGVELPTKGTVFISVKAHDKKSIVPVAKDLIKLGFAVMATDGTAFLLQDAGVAVARINKVHQGQPHIVDALINGQVQLVINTTEGAQALQDSFTIRRTALMHNIPYYTTLTGARAATAAIKALQESGGKLEPILLQKIIG